MTVIAFRLYHREMAPRHIDLNLMAPLQVLLEERSVSRAALRLHVSQPAMSSTLARLRSVFDDQLLVRRGNSYTLSPLASQLLDRLPAVIQSVEDLFAADPVFRPENITREFRILASDYAVATLGGSLISVMQEQAPESRITFVTPSRDQVNNTDDALRDLDGMLMPHGLLTAFPHLDLFLDRWVCVMDAATQAVGDEVTLDDLARLPWVAAFSGKTEFTPASKQLQLLGVNPRVVVGTQGFTSIPYLLVGSDRIALMQERIARHAAVRGMVRVFECPFDAPLFRQAFWWHPIRATDPAHAWLRSVLPLAVERAGLTDLAEA